MVPQLIDVCANAQHAKDAQLFARPENNGVKCVDRVQHAKEGKHHKAPEGAVWVEKGDARCSRVAHRSRRVERRAGRCVAFWCG